MCTTDGINPLLSYPCYSYPLVFIPAFRIPVSSSLHFQIPTFSYPCILPSLHSLVPNGQKNIVICVMKLN